MAVVLVKTVEEVCSLCSRRLANPWTLGREREIDERIAWITEKVRRRNEKVGMLNVTRKLRARRGRSVEQLEEEVARVDRGIEERGDRGIEERVEYIFEGSGAGIVEGSDRRMCGSECQG